MPTTNAAGSFVAPMIPEVLVQGFESQADFAETTVSGASRSAADYPRVPLGWRKVTLEWDSGWWQLDFKRN